MSEGKVQDEQVAAAIQQAEDAVADVEQPKVLDPVHDSESTEAFREEQKKKSPLTEDQTQIACVTLFTMVFHL